METLTLEKNSSTCFGIFVTADHPSLSAFRFPT